MDFSYKTSYIPLLIIKIVKLSGEDGRSRAEQLLHMLRQIDQYVSSPVEYQRRRGCRAVYEMVLKFRMVCISGNCALGCHGSCTHSKQVDRTVHGNFSNLPCKIAYRESFPIICFFHYLMSFFFFSFVQLPAAFVLPSREALCLGDRVVMYLPRCADTNSEVRKVSAQVSDWQAALLVSNKLILWTAIVTIIYMLKCISCISILPNFLLYLVEKSHKLLFG